MKITIDETKRGILVRDGKVAAFLRPGRHQLWSWRAEIDVQLIDLETPVSPFRREVAEVAPEDAWTELQVAENELAIVRVDGLPKACLRPGRYMLWQERAEVEATTYAMEALEPAIPASEWHLVPRDLARELTVLPFLRVLVYANGKMERCLEAGRYLLSTVGRELTLHTVELREREKTIVGQEIMTSDKVSLRMNLIVKFRSVDPVRTVEAIENLEDALYSEAQMAARRQVAGLTLDQLLEDRRAVSTAMATEVGERAVRWGVEVLAVDIKDVLLPGDMKQLLNRVIEAEKQAAAQVILRREETAATRSQANTAKMLEANPTLMRLRELEAMKEIAGSIDGLTIVAGANELTQHFLGRK